MTKKRTIKINNTLTGATREVVLPSKPVAKQNTGSQSEQAQTEGGSRGKNKR